MVQPRKEQIKNLKTRHALVSFNPYFPGTPPGPHSIDYPSASINSQMISGVSGGAQEDSPAVVLGTISEPFGIAPGAAIDISLNGAAPVTVALAVTDITASRVAKAINTAVTVDVAFSDEGVLGLFSNGSVGDDASIQIADNFFGTLASLGLTAGTYTGASVPTRGVVTTSPLSFPGSNPTDPNPRGAFIPLKDQRGKNITTDTSAIHPIQMGFGFQTRRAYIPGGAPVHARLTRTPDDSQYRISYYAQMPTEPTNVTFNSDFASLDGTDAVSIILTFKVKGPTGLFPTTIGPFAVTFPGPYPYNRDTVIDEINSAFATAAGSSGAASITGIVSQPFNFEAGAIMEISVDGGAFVPVAFNPAVDKDAATVAATINAAVGSPIATPSITATNSFVTLESLTTDGRRSAIEIRNSFNDPLRTLGFRAGLYRGYFIADDYGPEEIRIVGLGRGSDCSLRFLNFGPSTSARLGLSVSTWVGSDLGEVKVNFPELDFVDPSESHTALALFPEVLEYGEVDPAVESIVEKFNVKVLDNQWGNGADLITDGFGAAYPGAPSRGIKDAGKPVMVSPFGTINTGLISGAMAHIETILGKFVVGDLAPYIEQVDKIAISIIETPSGPNPSPASSTMKFYVDSDSDFGPGSREFIYYIDNNPLWAFTEDTDSTAWDQSFKLIGDNGLEFTDIPTGFLDPYTRASGISTGGIYHLNVTDSDNRYTKRFEHETSGDTPPHTILSKANSIWTCTVGDGTRSWGDFNGTDAIQQALAYWQTYGSGLSGCRIRCKAGIYEINVANGSIDIPSSDFDVVIEGESIFSVSIRVTDAISPAIWIDNSRLRLRDLRLTKTLATDAILLIGENSGLYADNVSFSNVKPQAIQECEIFLNKCELWARDTSCIDLRILASSDNGPIVARDCEFNITTQGVPAVRIEDAGVAGTTTVKNLLFERCQFNLEGADDDGAGNFSGNAGVLELVAGSTGFFTVTDVTWKDCEVNAFRGPNHTLLYLRTGDGVNEITIDRLSIIGGQWLAGPQNDLAFRFTPFYIGGYLNIVDNSYVNHVIIEDVLMGFSGTTSSYYGGYTLETDGGYFGIFDWAAFFINPHRTIKIHNWRFPNATVRSASGDLLVTLGEVIGAPYGGKWDIQGIYIDYDAWVDTDDFGTPEQRIQFLNLNSGATGSIDQVIVNFPPLTNAAVLKGVIKPMAAGRMTLRDCEVNGHSPAGFSRGAFFLDGDYDAASYEGLTMINCKATENVGNGFDWRDNVGIMEELKITQCTFNNNIENTLDATPWRTGHGICLYGTGTSRIRRGIITDNICNNNENFGIWVAPGDWEHYYNVVLSNNVMMYNRGSSLGDQIMIGDIASGGGAEYGFLARMTILGNMCGGSGSSKGRIVVATTTIPIDPDYILGIETEYDTPFPVTLASRDWGVAGGCIYNFAQLGFIYG